MSKQGEAAVKALANLLHQRVSVGNIGHWIDTLERVNQMYSPKRNELQSVLTLFGGTFNRDGRVVVATTIKLARTELRTIIQPRARVSSAMPGGFALIGWPVERASAGG